MAGMMVPRTRNGRYRARLCVVLCALAAGFLSAPSAFSHGSDHPSKHGHTRPASASAPTQYVRYWQPLNCNDAQSLGSSALAVMRSQMRQHGVNASAEDLAWLLDLMDRSGAPSERLKAAADIAAAQEIGGLMRRGFIVSAKMRSEQAASSSDSYKGSQFQQSFDYFLTAVTQPVAHASYKESDRAAGEPEAQGKDAGIEHTHGIDMEESSASLARIMSRLVHAAQVAGDDYKLPAVRFYVLSHGFMDPVATKVSAFDLCRLRLSKESLNRIDVAARYMSMPASSPELDPGFGDERRDQGGASGGAK